DQRLIGFRNRQRVDLEVHCHLAYRRQRFALRQGAVDDGGHGFFPQLPVDGLVVVPAGGHHQRIKPENQGSRRSRPLRLVLLPASCWRIASALLSMVSIRSMWLPCSACSCPSGSERPAVKDRIRHTAAAVSARRWGMTSRWRFAIGNMVSSLWPSCWCISLVKHHYGVKAF